MLTGGARVTTDQAEKAPRSVRWAGAVAIASVLVLGVIGALAIWDREQSQAEDRDRQLADQAAVTMTAQGTRNVRALTGASALVVDDGVITQSELDAFRADVTPGSALSAVAYEVIVPEDGRADYEATSGPIVDVVAGGTDVPSPDRPVHYVVHAVSPTNDTTTPLLGFDIRADPTRAAAADTSVQRHEATLSDPVLLAQSGKQGYFVVTPLMQPTSSGDQLVGFVSSAFVFVDAVQDVVDQLPDGATFAAADGELTLLGEPGKGVERGVDIGGREITVSVDDGSDPNPLAALGVLAAACLLALSLFGTSRRARRHERESSELAARLRVKRARAADVATIAHELSMAEDREAALAIMSTRLGGTVDADRVHVLVSGESAPDESSSGMVSTIELQSPTGRQIGLIRLEWDRPPADANLDPTLRTIGDLCSQTLNRIDAEQLQAERSRALSDLSHALTGAATTVEVHRCIAEHGTAPVAAAFANVVLYDPDADDLVVQLDSYLPADVAVRYRRFPVEAELPVALAFRDDEAVLVPNLRAWRERFPGAADDAASSGIVASASLPLRGDDRRPSGVMGFNWRTEVTFDATLVSILHTIADAVSQTLQRARLWDDQQRDARRSFALADLGRALAAAGSADEVATIVAERAPGIVGADAGNVGVLRRDGLALDCTYSDNVVDAHRRLHAVQSLDEHMPHVECVRSGQPLLLPDRASYEERFADVVPAMTEAGIHATMSWPMFDSSRQVIGVVGYAWKRPTRPDGTAVATIATIGELCAGALERTRSVDNRVRTARELTALTNALSTATTTAGVSSAVATYLPRLLDARSATLEVTSVGDPTDGTAEDRRTLVAPVAHSDPDRRAALVVSWDDEVSANDARAAALGTAAAIVGQTLERVHRTESEHELIASLQEEVLGRLPESLSLDVAATYIPASQTVSIGGDWYDVIELADGAIAFVIGDVVGHGLSAVASMTQIRATVRGLVRGGTDPTEVFLRATEMLTDAPTMMATVGLVVVDPSRATVRYASAGHPPALLVAPDGSVRRLDQALQRPLGWVNREAAMAEAELPVGGGLLLYTDGLVERRGEALPDSIERLAMVMKSASAGSATAREVLDQVIAEVFSSASDLPRTDDDVAVLFVRRHD